MTKPRYGIINYDMMADWMGRTPDADGPFWALNLMKYRAVAEYADGRATARSGRDADDEYTPRDSLRAIGAMIAFAADVDDQSGAEPRWDRIGIVRYPSRAKFLEMQQRDDFKSKHVHKDAGMECTIVMSCLPAAAPALSAADGDTIVMRVARTSTDSTLSRVDGSTHLAAFAVEGVIVGDERTWTQVSFDAAPDAGTRDALLAVAGDSDEIFAIALGRPVVDALANSIETAAGA